MKISITAVVCGLLFSTVAGAASTSAAILTIRPNSANHPYPSARGVTMIKISEPLEGGCAYVYIEASDKASLAVALAAKTAQAPTVIWYEPTIGSPWGDAAICALTAIQMG